MSDNKLRHLMAGIITFVCVLSYMSGYFSGIYGWWWTVVGLIIIYSIVYKIVDV